MAGSTLLQTCIPFDFNACELNLAGMLEVEKVAETMHVYTASTIHLSGHADASGSPDYNMLLSSQRVAQVADYLEMRGIEREQDYDEGKGEYAPLARNFYPDGSDAPLGRYLNRQVIVSIENPEPMQANFSGIYVPAH